MIPDPTEAALDEPKREETCRQAESGLGTVADAADLALDAAALLGNGALGMVGDAAGAVADATCVVLGATVQVAQVSLEVVGGVLSGLADL